MTHILSLTLQPTVDSQVGKPSYQVEKDQNNAQPLIPRYVPPFRNRPKVEPLRGCNDPYEFEITDEMLVKGLDYHLPSGLLKPTLNDEEVEFSSVRYGGGYTWHVPLTKQSLRPDHKALGEKSFTTPGTPTSLR
jgi:hypothetical protein